MTNSFGKQAEVPEIEKQLIRDIANLPEDTEIAEHFGGWDSRVYSFDAGRYFFKFPRSEEVKETYALEIAAIQLAEGCGTNVKVPKVMWQHPDNAYFGYEGMPGEPLNIVSEDLSEEQKQSAGTSIGEFLRDFHQRELEAAALVDIPEEIKRFHVAYSHALSPIREIFSEYEQARLEELVFGEIPARLEELGSSMQLCHGDLTPWNMVCDGEAQVGIIDFGKPCYCDASKDLIHFGDEIITEYALRAYGDTGRIREKVEARALVAEINALRYFSGKGIPGGVQKTAERMRKCFIAAYP